MVRRSMLKVAAATAVFGAVHSFYYEACFNRGVPCHLTAPQPSGIQLTRAMVHMAGISQ